MGRGTPRIVSRPPQWQTRQQLREEDTTNVEMALHGKLLVLKRSLMHLASLARVHRPPNLGQWPIVMRRVWEAAKRRREDVGDRAPPLPTFDPEATWARVQVGLQLAAKSLDRVARSEADTDKRAKRSSLRASLAAKGGLQRAFH
eukprot:5162678-Alexandrium_andersonii.AAC.1